MHERSVISTAAETEFGGGVESCTDTVARAEDFGFDYVQVVGLAESGDKQALSLLFRFSRFGGLDAASAEGHSAVMGELLRRVGDTRFGSLLRLESVDVRQAVLGDLEYDFGCDDAPELRAELLRDFPVTCRN